MGIISEISVGAASHQGGRSYQEDRYFVAGNFEPQQGRPADGLRRSLVGVFDGHGQSGKAAEHCAHRLPQLLAAEPALFGDSNADGDRDAQIAATLQRCFTKVDDELLFNAELKDGDRSGTTAVLALCMGNLLYTAHVGDSGALLVRDGKAARLTEDHTPNQPREHDRIVERGGRILEAKNRVISEGPGKTHLLAMSRSIGDPDFKPNGKRIVTSTPDVRVVELNPADSAVVLASDGVWDVVSDEEIAHITNKVLQGGMSGNENLAEATARATVEAALHAKTGDNVTSAVMMFHWQ